MNSPAANALIDREELAALVPHKGRMFLLSRIVSWDMNRHSLAAEYDITGDCLFFREELDGLPSWAGFELMAQSISALSGLQGRVNGRSPQYGFILSVSGLILRGPVLKGTVRIEVEEDTALTGSDGDTVYVFHGRVFCGAAAKALTEAKLTVMDADMSMIKKAVRL